MVLSLYAVVNRRRRIRELELRAATGDDSLRHFFEQIPVGLWRQDLSRVRSELPDLPIRDAQDLAQYLEAKPDELNRLLSLVRNREVNSETVRLLEAPNRPALLARFQEIFPPEARIIFARLLDALARGQESSQAEAEILTLEGNRRRVLLRLVKNPRDEDWSDIHLAMVETSADGQDLKKNRETERRLLDAQKLDSLGCLASGVAHDFNNLLMSILGNADLALQEIQEETQGAAALQEIHHSSLKAADLCQQMLAYSGRGEPSFHALDLNEMTLNLSFLLRSLVPRKIQYHQDLSATPPVIQGDGSQIQQVVVNLLNNAVEAIGEREGHITLETGQMEATEEYLLSSQASCPLRPGHYAFIRVEDDGAGIDPQLLSQIFDPFFTTKFSFRGMGLAAVLGIVRMHQGSVLVSSEPGRGTTMTVLVPLSGAAVVAEPALQPSDEELVDWQGSGQILLADDEPGVRRVATRMLDKLGFEVILAEDGLQAVEIFNARQDGIDIVILDLTMPRLGGHEACARIRQMDPRVPIILSSGYNEQEVRIGGEDPGPSAFIPKPYTLKRLRRILNKVAASRTFR